ncbi:acyl-CoA dehydrogenase [Pseudarthrobacter sulfonivorans]|uniref:Acyl-CoA dehydrogenase n=1 Tax=Pseudarthrobacter sulfonivorans TaxID=121292 RepID=A0A0U3P3H1_9MICC|nr:acyl-CoA dehydrogenase family protein [Pseudarthrobacter sulfonivorans]ALV39888.1 acyl-CoA dehydrogenase [Pseudarthrobacter sulfonivorans]
MLLTSEHHAFRSTIASFVEKEVQPYVDEWEAKGCFPAHELFRKLGDLGVFGLAYDPQYGGDGADHSYLLIAAEELGRIRSAGVSMGIGVHMMMSTPSLHEFGTEELKRKYLVPALRGETVSAIGVTEPDAGSDVAGLRTKATIDGDEWVINGLKTYITNGTQADWICLLARTTDEGGYRGMSQIIVDMDTPGVSISRSLEKLGNRSSDTAEIKFENVRVPISNTIGEAGRGFQQQMSQFVVERMFACYSRPGALQDALDRTAEYLQQRTVFGRPLAANQYISFTLAELSARLDVMRFYNWSMVEAFEAGEDTTRMATIGKLLVGRLSREIADACLQFHGGLGYMEEHWTARFLRDHRLMSIGGGADEVMLQVLSKMDGFSAD